MELKLELAEAKRQVYELQARLGLSEERRVVKEVEMIAPLPPFIKLQKEVGIEAEYDYRCGWKIFAWGYGKETHEAKLQLGYYMQAPPNVDDVPYILGQMHGRFMRQLLHWIRKNK